MPALIWVPGLLGTELVTAEDSVDQLLWVNLARIASCELFKMTLAADGTSPGGDEGENCYPRHPLPEYFKLIEDIMRTSLRGDGYYLNPFGFDFRKSMIQSGHELANRVRAITPVQDPSTIVAYSQGGIVTRIAWADLVRTNEQSLVRRIITIGTPHHGSYGTPVIWSADDAQLDNLWWAKNLSTLVPKRLTVFFGPRFRTTDEIISIISSWPAMYELLPVLSPNYDADDPHRSDIYNAANWPPARHVSQAWLDHASNVFQPILASPNSRPPGHVLTTVIGTGTPTPTALLSKQLIGKKGAFLVTNNGDGRVDASEASLPGAKEYYGPAVHGAMTRTPWILTYIREWVLEERAGNPGPTPTAVIVDSAMTTGRNELPIPDHAQRQFSHDC